MLADDPVVDAINNAPAGAPGRAIPRRDCGLLWPVLVCRHGICPPTKKDMPIAVTCQYVILAQLTGNKKRYTVLAGGQSNENLSPLFIVGRVPIPTNVALLPAMTVANQ